MMNWDDLRYLLAAARAEGLSGAARTLNTTHATVSRRISRMEADLAQPLFDRLPTGLRLTEAGAEAMVVAERVESELLSLDRSLAARGKGISGTIRVTVPPLIVTDSVATDFRDFRAAHPDIDLEVLGDNRILNLHRREADIAIRVSRTPSETLWGRRLASQQAAYYAKPDLAEKVDAAMSSPRVPYTLPFISFTAWSELVPKVVIDNFQGVEVVARCDDMVAALRLAVSGMGVVRMPVFLGEDTDGLARIPKLPSIEYPPIWILTHPDLKSTPRVTAFMRFIADRFVARRADYVV